MSDVQQTRGVMLKEQAYSEIKKKIQDATFPSGSFLSERRLSSMLGMSKTPVKAALERLEFEGFVSVAPQQGVVVRDLSAREVADLFELRRALETFCLRAIAGRLSAAQSSVITRNLAGQLRAAKSCSAKRFVVLDAEFHLALCGALGNDAITESLVRQRDRTHRVVFEIMARAPQRLTAAVSEHESIFQAVQKNHPDRAVSLLEEHLEIGRKFHVSELE